MITKYTRYIIAFASGVVIGANFFELMPKALLELPNEAVFLFLAFGFFTFYFIEKISLLHACGEMEAHKKLNIKIIFLVALGLLFLYLIHSLENLLSLE